MSTYTQLNFERKKASNLLHAVFRSVRFDDADQKKLLCDSYSANFMPMILYAEDNKLNQTEYILSVRDCLLECKGARDALPNLNLYELIKFAESKKVNAAYYLHSLLNKKIQTEKAARELAITIRENELAWRNNGR